MFGMGEQKKAKLPAWEFDLEKDLKNPSEFRKTVDQINDQTQKLKNMMRQGLDNRNYDQSQKLLAAFIAAKKVCERITRREGR